MSDTVLLGLFGLLGLALKEYFDYKRAETAARKVEEVRTTLKDTVTTTDAKLEHIVSQTNGMVEKLERVAFNAGVKSETDKKGGGK